MALYFYFNETTGDLVYSDQASYAGEGYTALGEQANMNPRVTDDWVYDSNRSSIKTVAKDPASGKIVGLTSMASMFTGCSSLASLDLSGFNIPQVTDMFAMFSGCSSLTSLDLSGFDTSLVTSMSGMFNGCSGLTSLDLSGFDTSLVTSMDSMFYGCSGLTSLDLSGFDTPLVTRMTNMFFGCSGLTSLDLSGFDTSQVTNMSFMFRNCSSLTSLDLSGFDTSQVRGSADVFANTPSLARIHIGPGYTIGMPAPGSSVAGRDGNWHAIGGASYAPSSVPRVDAVYYAAADLAPDGGLLVNLEDLKAALMNRGGLPLTKDTVIAESEGKPVWAYAANAIDDGVPGFISRIAQGVSWIEATFGCVGLRIEGSRLSDAGQKKMSISMEMNFDGPVIKFGDEGLRGVLTYQDGMPVLTAMGENGPIMAGDHPYGFAAYATDDDFMDYVFALE